MSFAEPRLAALALAPLAVIALLVWTRHAREDGHAAFVARARGLATWPRAALRAAFAAVVFALAAMGPQWGYGWVKTPGRGLDVVVVQDASRSMRARDLAPNRLERAWSELDALADAQGPWRLGLVRFRGAAEPVSPLTEDHASVALLARETDPESVPGAGSGLARGVRAALELFDAGPNRRRVALLLTDGESRSDEDVASAIAAAREHGVTVIGLLIGTRMGAPVPQDDAPDAEPLRDARGAVVSSRARSDVLDAFAAATNGRVYDLAADPFAMRHIVDDELRSRMPTVDGFAREWQPIDRSEWFVGLGLLVLVPWWRLAPRTRAVRPLALVVLCASAPWMFGAQDPGELGRRANAAFARGKPAEAVAPLEALAALSPSDPSIAFDLGLAHLRSDAYDAARTAFRRAADATYGRSRAEALHGVALACAEAARVEESRGGERLAAADALLVAARAALVSALAESGDDAMRSNLDVVSFRLERIRAEREASPPAAPGAGSESTSDPDPTASTAAGSSGASNSTAGDPRDVGTGGHGTASTTSGGVSGAVEDDSAAPRLPGGMFRAEAEHIVDVVRRFERERRAFDRERARSVGPSGGNDW